LGRRVYLLIAALFTAAVVFGCSHSNLGPWELGDLPSDQPVDFRDVPDAIEASLGEIRIHSFDIDFAATMYASSVGIEMWDELGKPVDITRRVYSESNNRLTISLPSHFCETYGLRILAGAKDIYGNVLGEDILFEVPMGPNPYDLDMSASCNADTAISPVFTDEVDAMILSGDDAAQASGLKEMDYGDVLGNLVWYTNGSQSYDGGGRMIVIPELAGVGTTGAAKLFMAWGDKQVKNYTLEVWTSYDPVLEEPSAVFTQTVYSSGESLIGPFDAGDLNGDGARDIIVAGQKSTTDRNLLQRVFLLDGPIAAGEEMDLSDASAYVPLIGSLYDVQKPLVSVGDIDGDGFDDLASISYRISEEGETGDWKVDMYYGDDDLVEIFRDANHSRIMGSLGREILDVSSGDINGDYIPDLIVADAWKVYTYGWINYRKPRVLVFFGGKRLNGIYVEQADLQININMNPGAYLNTLHARSIGDIDGNGIDDLALGLIEQSSSGTIGQSNVYVLLGRTSWEPGMIIAHTTFLEPQWSLRIVSDSSRKIVLHDDYWEPMVGDVDNDGYYDLMLKVLDYSGPQIMLYPGHGDFKVVGGDEVELDAASAAWSFSVR